MLTGRQCVRGGAAGCHPHLQDDNCRDSDRGEVNSWVCFWSSLGYVGPEADLGIGTGRVCWCLPRRRIRSFNTYGIAYRMRSGYRFVSPHVPLPFLPTKEHVLRHLRAENRRAPLGPR